MLGRKQAPLPFLKREQGGSLDTPVPMGQGFISLLLRETPQEEERRLSTHPQTKQCWHYLVNAADT